VKGAGGIGLSSFDLKDMSFFLLLLFAAKGSDAVQGFVSSTSFVHF